METDRFGTDSGPMLHDEALDRSLQKNKNTFTYLYGMLETLLHNKYWILSLLSLLLLGSCSQLSSLQTGRTLGKDEKMIGAYATAYGLHEDISSGGELGSLVLPQVGFWGQYGINDKLDVGLKVSSGANIGLLGKYQIMGDQESTWALSLGGSAEYQFAGAENLVFRTHVPIYCSWHPQPKLSVYATPRYIFQYVADDDPTHFLGSAAGVHYAFGDRWNGLFESSFSLPFSATKDFNNAVVFQAGFGVQYRF